MTGDRGFLALLQFADGLFPAGGFAHSFGLAEGVPELETHVAKLALLESLGLPINSQLNRRVEIIINPS